MMISPANFSRPGRMHYSAAIVSGALLVFSFPRFAWDWLAWLALVPLLFVLTQEGLSLRRAFVLGFITGWVFFFFSANWITHSMIRYGGMNIVLAYAAAALFTAITGLFPGLFALLTRQLIKGFGLQAVGFAPLIWGATEWLRGVLTNTTWNAVSVSQVNQPAIIPYAQMGGTIFVSAIVISISAFVILLVNIKVAAVKRIAIFYFMLALFAFVAEYLGSLPGYFSPPPIGAASAEVKVAGVQPNLPVDILTHSADILQRNNGGLATNTKLTREAINQSEAKKADIIVWAESPLVLNYEQDETVKAELNALAKETNAYVIFSAVARDGAHIYNSAQTITPDGRALKRYDKIRLVPFGEYVPLRAVLGYFVPPMIGDFTPGDTAVVNALKLAPQKSFIQNEKETQGEVALERTTNFAKLGTFICYEAAYPNIVRQFVNNGASFLINISDDAWFGNSAGAAQHLNHAQMRAIENDRGIVRVTNSGISALLTADGKVVDVLPSFAAASKVWTVETRKGITLYTRYGDWFAYLSVVITAIAIIFSFVYSSRSK